MQDKQPQDNKITSSENSVRNSAENTEKASAGQGDAGRAEEGEGAPFAHLHQRSSTVVKHGTQSKMTLFIGGSALFVIVLLMVVGAARHHKRVASPVPPVDTSVSAIDTTTFRDNLQRLAAMQKASVLPDALRPEIGDSKAIVARRNAPTQMFSLEASENTPSAGAGVGGDAGASATPTTSATLAGEGQFTKYANNQATTVATVAAQRIAHPDYTVAEGEFVNATLETAINSDLPGRVRAVVTQPVYAYTGEQALIPAGSRLIGQYAAQSSNGAASTWVFIMWNRIITPEGVSMLINSPGNDSLGRAGSEADAIDSHFLHIFGTAALLSIIGASTANAGVTVNDQPNSSDAYRQSMANAFQQSAQTLLQKTIEVKPTLHVHQGSAITVFVARDVDLFTALGQPQ